MTWTQAVVVAVLVAGAVIAGARRQDQLAGVLAGAAAGIVAPHVRPPTGPAQAQLATVAPLGLALVGGGLGTLAALGAIP